MDAPRRRAAAEADSTALVLSNIDLLADIISRVDSPTWLLRAALVSKTWLRVASDPDLLDGFRKRHPPRVLTVTAQDTSGTPRLLAIPQPSGLAAAARIASRTLANLSSDVHLPGPFELLPAACRDLLEREFVGRQVRCVDYRNGRLLVELMDGYYVPRSPDREDGICPTLFHSYLVHYHSYAVASLLHEDRKIILPSLPHGIRGAGCCKERLFLMDKEDDAESCLYISVWFDTGMVLANFSILRSGVWGLPQHSTMRELGQKRPSIRSMCLSGGKLYMVTTTVLTSGFRYIILALDLATATFSAMELPEGAEDCVAPGTAYLDSSCLAFSRAERSGLYLIGTTSRFQLHVWHGDGAGQWAPVDTISVREACTAQLNVQAWSSRGDHARPVRIVGAGDNAEFVILQLVASGIICCMQLGNRDVEKVFEGDLSNLEKYSSDSQHVHPITMVWPPYLPAVLPAVE